MTYTAQSIEEVFTRIASIRIGEKISGDGGYWYGGRCEWGGAHNLQEDCQTLGKLFDGITELKNTRQELTKFDNQQKFEKSKQNLFNKTSQAISNLKMNTGGSTPNIRGGVLYWMVFFTYKKNTYLQQKRALMDRLRVRKSGGKL